MTVQDAIERLEAMVEDTHGLTWDHSPNDIEALRLILKEIERLQTMLDTASPRG